MKKLTFLTKEEIKELEKRHNENPHLREAHKALAREVITDLHGIEEYNNAVKISECLFNGNINELNEDDIISAFKGVPTFSVNFNETLLETLVNNNIVSSRREGREFLSNNSITVNGVKINDENRVIDNNILLYNKYLIIRKGKKKYFIGKLV